jgi:peroxiredoxin/uncharacterized membrane protein YphA (DoxX/SURF4 family)
MDLILLAIKLILVLVLIVAGSAKLFDRDGTAEALSGFGVPKRLIGPSTLGLPFLELGLAMALLPGATAWWAALGTAGLLAIFCGAIIYLLAKGRSPECHCFGQLYSKPISQVTLLRNFILLGLAALLVTIGTGPDALGWLSDLNTGQKALLLVTIAGLALLGWIGWLLSRLLKQLEALLTQMPATETESTKPKLTIGEVAKRQQESQGLPSNSPAPGFSLSDTTGQLLSLAELRAAHKPILLVFSSTHCPLCLKLLPEISQWQREYAQKLVIALIFSDDPEEVRSVQQKYELNNVLLDINREVTEAYHANAEPGAQIVLPNGKLGSSMSIGKDAISSLVGMWIQVFNKVAL